MSALAVAVERWPIAGRFAIARGAKTEAVVVVATVTDGPWQGRGECVPYARYGETVEGVLASLQGVAEAVAAGLDRPALAARLPPGAARNALDCALWELEARRSGRRVWELAGLPPPVPVTTAFTLSLDEPGAMARAAAAAAGRPLLKLKLGGAGDAERIDAVRRAAPAARLVVDANESWTDAIFDENLAACEAAGVELIEQPLPAGADEPLAQVRSRVLLCADESFHDRASFAAVAGRYGAINLKLDKAGGLTEALAVVAEARARRIELMVGCMLATSLAMAPAVLLASAARIVDLDGPLLLARDRAPGLVYRGSTIVPAEPAPWG